MFFTNGPQSKSSNTVTRDELDAALLAAYQAEDNRLIARLYGEAGDASGDVDEACFFWTQAYVFALEAGMQEAACYRKKLKAHGRET